MSRIPAAARPNVNRLLVALCLLATGHGFGLGILIPRVPEVSPIQLGDAEVSVEIANNLARTRVMQEFVNPNSRQLEADFYFPVPRGASVTDFVLYMNGKPVKGEVVDKDKARQIYEDIVRRMKDPGLIEWVDYNLFKVRVFPVPANGTQKLELEFAQPLEADQGMFRYLFPLKAPQRDRERAAREAKARFSALITSDEPVRNVYSPTHTVDADLKDPRRVKVTVPEGKLGAAGDLVLYYEYSNKDVALSLLATRPGIEDGYFCLMLSPPVRRETAPAPMDMVFVIDTSGSMLDDNKIEQARRALLYCVGQLREQDRFNIIRFATEVDKFRDELVSADKTGIAEARRFIEGLRASGGTNISGALSSALGLRNSVTTGSKEAGPGRPMTIVFITDGMPTIGTTNPEQILKILKNENPAGVRVFTFGVGYDVNTKLLDGVADATRAVSEYTKPGQDLEVPVSRFFDKVSRPVMTGLKLDLPGAEVVDLYPSNLPDLFHGGQVTVFGRYRKPGPVAIRLSGTLEGKPVELTYEKKLPESERGNDFVEKLWGARKVAFLLDEIRRNGETGEVRDEVVKLARKYGIVTPYTSYLVVEDEKFLTEDRPRRPGVVGPPRPEPQRWSRSGERPVARNRMFDSAAPAAGAMEARAPALGQREALQASSGESAVAASKAIRRMASARKAEDLDGAESISRAGGRTFQLRGGIWVDTSIGSNDPVRLRIRALSDAYFAALRLNPTLKSILALGDRVRVKLGGSVVEFGPEGKEQLDTADETVLKAGE